MNDQVMPAVPSFDERGDQMTMRANEVDRQQRRLAIKGTLSLCARCSNGTVIKRACRNMPALFCGFFGKWMPDDIETCSRYQAAGSLDVWTLARMAKLIDNEIVKEKVAGFRKDQEP